MGENMYSNLTKNNPVIEISYYPLNLSLPDNVKDHSNRVSLYVYITNIGKSTIDNVTGEVLFTSSLQGQNIIAENTIGHLCEHLVGDGTRLAFKCPYLNPGDSWIIKVRAHVDLRYENNLFTTVRTKGQNWDVSRPFNELTMRPLYVYSDRYLFVLIGIILVSISLVVVFIVYRKVMVRIKDLDKSNNMLLTDMVSLAINLPYNKKFNYTKEWSKVYNEWMEKGYIRNELNDRGITTSGSLVNDILEQWNSVENEHDDNDQKVGNKQEQDSHRNIKNAITEFLREGKYKESKNLAETWVNAAPNDKELSQLYILSLIGCGDIESIKSVWRYIRDNKEQDPRIYINIGEKLWRSNQLDNAIECTQMALNISDNNRGRSQLLPYIKANLAFYYAESRKELYRRDAMTYSDEAYKLLPQNTGIKDTRGYVLVIFSTTFDEVTRGIALCKEALAEIQKQQPQNQELEVLEEMISEHIAQGGTRLTEMIAL